MAPLYPVETIQYKTYIKNALVKSLGTIFSNHPDDLLRRTRATIDFPMTEADYPAVVIRFYERSIKNAGVAHYEDRLIDNLYSSKEIWFDNFEGIRSSQDYKVRSGTYVQNGNLSPTNVELIPWIGADFGLNNQGHRVHANFFRKNAENTSFRVGLASSLNDLTSFIGEVNMAGTSADVSIIYRDNTGAETTLQTGSFVISGDQDVWIDMSVEYDGEIHFEVDSQDPFRTGTVEISGSALDATASSSQMASIVTDESKFWVGGTASGNNSFIRHFRTLRTNVSDQRFYRFKHNLYNGDIEFAVYALSSYDRDLVSDTLVQILAMGDLSSWTNALNEKIYGSGVNPEHFINLNTDEIQGFGETQQLAPWGPEDVMVYQTSYRVGIFGHFYSKAPSAGDLGLVERVETYPYMDGVESVPNPNDSGPDHTQGTADDIPDATPWTG